MKRRTLLGTGGLTGFTSSDYAGPQPANANAKALLRGLGELGYVYGKHYVTEVRSVEGKLN